MKNMILKTVSVMMVAMIATPLIAYADNPKENYNTIMEVAQDEGLDESCTTFLVATAHQESRGKNIKDESNSPGAGHGIFNLTTQNGDVDDLMNVQKATLILVDKINDRGEDCKDMKKAYKNIQKSLLPLEDKSIDFAEEKVDRFLNDRNSNHR